MIKISVNPLFRGGRGGSHLCLGAFRSGFKKTSLSDVGWVEGRNPTDQSLVLGFAALNPTYPSALLRFSLASSPPVLGGVGAGFCRLFVVRKIGGRKSPYKIDRAGDSSIRKISICVHPHLRLSAFISGFKKTRLHGRGAIAHIIDNYR